MPKFWTPFFSGQSLLLSTTILNDKRNYEFKRGVHRNQLLPLKLNPLRSTAI